MRDLVAGPPPAELDPVLAAIEAHRSAYTTWQAGRAESTIDPEDPSDAQLAAADALLDDLAAMVPQSIAGLIAYIEYFAAYAQRDEDPAIQRPALASIVIACRQMLASPK